MLQMHQHTDQLALGLRLNRARMLAQDLVGLHRALARGLCCSHGFGLWGRPL